MRRRWLVPAIPASLVLMLAAASGCDQNGTNAGLTNGPPPAGGEKSAGRSDLPGSIGSGQGEILGRTGDASTNSGTGGMGGGTEGAPKVNPAGDPDTVRANPPVRGGGDPNSAAGGTKPSEPINTGTPRGPQ